MARTTLSTFTFSPAPSRIESTQIKLLARTDGLKKGYNFYSLKGKKVEGVEIEGVIVNQPEHGLGTLSEKQQIEELLEILDAEESVQFTDETWGSSTVLVEGFSFRRRAGEKGYSYKITMRKLKVG